MSSTCAPADAGGPDRRDGGPGAGMPWFRLRPRAAAAVAAVLFLGVFVLRWRSDTVGDMVTTLYALPVALLAVTFGRRAGVSAGLLAVALTVVWVLHGCVSVSVLGWVSRVLPLLVLGALLGDASDRLRAAEESRRAVAATAAREHHAAEVNDTLVQGMAAALWALDAGRVESGTQTLRQTLELGHELVSSLLRDSDAGVGGRRRPPAGD